MKPCVLIIAGVDPSGAAGLLTDIQTICALGAEPSGVVTATTIQGYSRFMQKGPVASDLIAQQLQILCEDAPMPHAIKVGMLGDLPSAQQVANYLDAAARHIFTVIDPVLVSSSGGNLADSDVLACYRERLIPRADLLTPNLPEAEALLQQSIQTLAAMESSAHEFLKRGAKAVLLKGGHLGPQQHIVSRGSGLPLALDRYCDQQGRATWIATPALNREARGTGCSLSSAIATAIALGHEPIDAVVMARAYVQHGLSQAHHQRLHHAPWPVKAHDFPWLGASLNDVLEHYAFPSTGPRQLGFYPIVDRASWIPRLAEQGVDLLQLRIKDLQGEALTREIMLACREAKARNIRLFINDYWDLAIRYGAYGVHLGQEDLDTADLQTILTAGLRLGISTHSYSELARAKGLHPSYIALGPIYETTCKSMRFGPQGPLRISEWRALTNSPLVAIGGLRLRDAKLLHTLGADGLAVISDLMRASEPEARAQQWLGACQ